MEKSSSRKQRRSKRRAQRARECRDVDECARAIEAALVVMAIGDYISHIPMLIAEFVPYERERHARGGDRCSSLITPSLILSRCVVVRFDTGDGLASFDISGDGKSATRNAKDDRSRFVCATPRFGYGKIGQQADPLPGVTDCVRDRCSRGDVPRR